LPLLDQILDELKKLKRRHGVLLNQDHFIDLLKEYYRNPSFVNRKCKVSTYSMNFLANGDVGICGFSGVVGNIRDKTPKELWKSKTLKETRLRMRNCRKCLLNCYYTPPLYDLIKDFMIYPAGREVFNAI
jgi:MoaA/NifB/PqqE/SkfB family radical SAM enzyme